MHTRGYTDCGVPSESSNAQWGILSLTSTYCPVVRFGHTKIKYQLGIATNKYFSTITFQG